MRERGNLNEIVVAPGRQLDHALHAHDRARLPGRRAHHEGLPLQGARLVPAQRAERLPGLRDRLQRATSTTIRATTRRTATARATTRRSTSTGCATRACSRTARAHDGRVTRARKVGEQDGDDRAPRSPRRRSASATRRGTASRSSLSAQHSLEDNWALRELARARSAPSAIYVTGAGPGLRRRHPHRRGQEPEHRAASSSSLPTLRPFPQLIDDIRAGQVAHVIALGGVTPRNDPEDATALGMRRARSSSSPRTKARSPRPRTSSCPPTSWAEHSGTYVNRQGLAPGRRQGARAARRLAARVGAAPRARRRARPRADLDEARRTSARSSPAAVRERRRRRRSRVAVAAPA